MSRVPLVMAMTASCSDNRTVPHEHETVHLRDLPIRGLNEIENGRGRNALSLRRAARQGQQ